jgi:hypothetical protein
MFKNVSKSLMNTGVKMWFHHKNGSTNAEFMWNNILLWQFQNQLPIGW